MTRFLITIAAGVAIGILIAPEKGTDTRKKIAELPDNIRRKWDELVGSLLHKVERTAADIDAKATEVLN